MQYLRPYTKKQYPGYETVVIKWNWLPSTTSSNFTFFPDLDLEKEGETDLVLYGLVW